MKISLKIKIIIGVVLVLLFFAVAGIYIYVVRDKLISNMNSGKIELDVENYKGIVEYSSDISFMLVVNKSNEVSNIIFLDKDSVEVLADKNIEGKSIEDASYSIMEILNNKGLASKNIILTSFQDNDSVNLIENAINKNLVIFGLASKVSHEKGNLSSRVEELNLESKSTDIDNVKVLYEYSRNLLLDDAYNKMDNSSTSEDVVVDAKDIYNQLVVYSKGEMDGFKVKVDNQEKNDPNGLLITDLESSRGRKVDSNSWYSITNSVVVADISIDGHEFCFNGSIDNYIEESCK